MVGAAGKVVVEAQVAKVGSAVLMVVVVVVVASVRRKSVQCASKRRASSSRAKTSAQTNAWTTGQHRANKTGIRILTQKTTKATTKSASTCNVITCTCSHAPCRVVRVAALAVVVLAVVVAIAHRKVVGMVAGVAVSQTPCAPA